MIDDLSVMIMWDLEFGRDRLDLGYHFGEWVGVTIQKVAASKTVTTRKCKWPYQQEDLPVRSIIS